MQRPNAREWCALSTGNYMVQQLPCKFVAMDRWRILIWIFSHNQRRDVPWGGWWILSQCHRRMRGILRNPVGRCIDRLIFGYDLILNRQFPCQRCNDHGRNYWLRPPCRWSIALDGIIVDMAVEKQVSKLAARRIVSRILHIIVRWFFGEIFRSEDFFRNWKFLFELRGEII